MYFYWKIILVNTIFVNNTFFLIFLKYKPIYLLCMYLVTRAGAAMLQLCYLVVQWAAQLQLKLLCYFILREDELQHVSCHLVIPVLFFSWNKYSLVDHMLSPASLMSFFLFFKFMSCLAVFAIRTLIWMLVGPNTFYFLKISSIHSLLAPLVFLLSVSLFICICCFHYKILYGMIL